MASSKPGNGTARNSQSAKSGAKSATASGSAKPVSNYSIHKAYGGTLNFMHSHGLKMSDPDDVAEMHAITDAMKEADRREAAVAGTGGASAKHGRGGAGPKRGSGNR